MKKILFIISIVLLLSSCSHDKKHFISDEQQRNKIEQDYINRKNKLPSNCAIHNIDKNIPLQEEEALKFLYAYMPLSDITDYSSTFFHDNVKTSFIAKAEMPWGDSIPEREFAHFVIPIRVNNENLDSSRIIIYETLKERVRNLSLYEAVIEVNRWCQEKVRYQGSDSRTSSPLATIKTSWGRCGEESTLLVAALRALCIPARQVYTPRWAHCDDNHAWVEAFVDGKWHFLGACEPEPVLDLGWFNAPASRCLLLHTRVFGHYFGPEEVIQVTDNYTEINVVDNYADISKINITVTDEAGKPIPNVDVDFKIYNYSEYNTVASKKTDKDGKTWLTAGLGSMMIFASNNGKFDYKLVNFGQDHDITLTLTKVPGETLTTQFDIVPPAEKPKIPHVSEAQRAINNSRCALGDSLRNAYVATFTPKVEQALGSFANSDQQLIQDLLKKSWGNYQTLIDFLTYAQNHGMLNKAIDLLSVVTDKDLRDITFDVLIDNLHNTPNIASDLYNEYILNPRVANEMLHPYKKYLHDYFAQDSELFITSPSNLIDWIKDNITINDDMNVRHIPMSPCSIVDNKITDSYSRDLFFVAAARSIGIPARKDPVTGKIQYHNNIEWTNVSFTEETLTSAIGFLNIKYRPLEHLTDPKYYTHFSIKRWNGHCFELLAYDAADPGMDVGMSLSAFGDKTPLEEGYYVLTSGTRLADGSVLSQSTFFNITANEVTSVELVMREPTDGVRVIGNFNIENRYLNENKEQSLLQTAGRGFYVLGLLDHGSEPTSHAMIDIASLRDEFEKWGEEIIFIFQSQDALNQFKTKHYENLPNTISIGINDGKMLEEIKKNMLLNNNQLPIFLIANSNNEVVFFSQGYTIGLGEQLIKTIHALSR